MACNWSETHKEDLHFVLVLVVLLVLIVAPKSFIEPGQKPLLKLLSVSDPGL
jgi:hypothetical protein